MPFPYSSRNTLNINFHYQTKITTHKTFLRCNLTVTHSSPIYLSRPRRCAKIRLPIANAAKTVTWQISQKNAIAAKTADAATISRIIKKHFYFSKSTRKSPGTIHVCTAETRRDWSQLEPIFFFLFQEWGFNWESQINSWERGYGSGEEFYADKIRIHALEAKIHFYHFVFIFPIFIFILSLG